MSFFAYTGRVTGRAVTKGREVGLVPWTPNERPQRRKGGAPPYPSDADLIAAVQVVLQQYDEFKPMPNRQIFYRLVATIDFEKSELASNQLGNKINRARRAGLIDFEDIRDDGTSIDAPPGWSSEAQFRATIRSLAQKFDLMPNLRQPTTVEIWCESTGMVPQLIQAADGFATVVASSGFNSLTGLYNTAERVIERSKNGQETALVFVGDYDPSGSSIMDRAAEDVWHFVDDLGGDTDFLKFAYAAITEEQAQDRSLPSKPQKGTDKRGEHMAETWQAEALPPDDLRDAVRSTVMQFVDDAIAAQVAEESQDLRERLTEELDD